MITEILIAVPVLLIMGLSIQLIRILFQQKAELFYHANFPKTIVLSSTDFLTGSKIPIEFTAKGNNISPPLYWNNLPHNTRSLVVLVTDYDAPAPYLKLFTVTHWAVYNINPDVKNMDKGIKSTSSENNSISFGLNVYKELKYTGPNPLLGTHRYFFRIYALAVPDLNLDNPTKEKVMESMKNHVLAYGELIGTY